MDLFDIFHIPKNPKLKFGEPLDDFCKNGVLHAGLKDLFLKAYLSARSDDLNDSKNVNVEEETTSPVLLALKPGPIGQGSLSQRLSLKARLEAGEWLIATQTPAGAPLWLLRHFLGRLPQPLLEGSHWKILGTACGAAAAVATAVSGPDAASGARLVEEVLERIAASTRTLNQVEFEVLALLALLIRKLSLESQAPTSEPRHDALNALSQYFIASIIVRPFRPGLYTPVDEECQPLLVFLSKYWDVVFRESQKALDLRYSEPGDSGAHFGNEGPMLDDGEKNSGCIFISFESLLIIENNEHSKESTGNGIDSNCSRKRNKADDLKVINSDSTICQTNFLKENSVLESSTKNSNNETTIINASQTQDYDYVEMVDTNRYTEKEKLASQKYISSAIPSIKFKNGTSDVKTTFLENGFLFNCLQEDYDVKFENRKNTVKSNAAEYEFFSISNSEDSQ